MHYLKHPRKKLGTRSQKQLRYPTEKLAGSRETQETFHLQ